MKELEDVAQPPEVPPLLPRGLLEGTALFPTYVLEGAVLLPRDVVDGAALFPRNALEEVALFSTKELETLTLLKRCLNLAINDLLYYSRLRATGHWSCEDCPDREQESDECYCDLHNYREDGVVITVSLVSSAYTSCHSGDQ